ncbi:MAG: insulinase family protein [Ardenticatenales bacterium]|nr:insulinase family protein [Ardenticatenales bacterium]
MYELSTLDNGLRLVTVAMPHAYSVSVGLYLTVGSRYEEPHLAGISHFIEHMLFKGTERRPTPRDIALTVESVGGDINASTGHEMTTYYARVSRDHLPIATDVLVDMLRNSRFLANDVERERQVIIEEINESLDIPDELVYMQFNELLWPGHALARDIAGSRESVRGLTREALRSFMERAYTPAHTVLAVAGALTHAGVRDLLQPILGSWPGGDGFGYTSALPLPGPTARAMHRPIEQSHFLLGTRALSRFDEDRFAFSLLNIILGEGMSSRLFTEIREKRGLAYTVYGHTLQLMDTGSFAVYAGLDSDNLQEAIEAVLEQLNLLREKAVSAEELAMAKAYARGRTLLRLEDSGANAGWVGGQLAMSNTILTPDEVLGRLDKVTQDDILRVARRLFRDDALVLSLVGPVDEDEPWAEMLKVE